MSQLYMPFDCETGDLSPQSGDLLTLYIAIMDEEFKILDELDLKLKPDNGRFPIANAGALKVNGIDLKSHMEDPNTITYSEGKNKIVEMIKRHLKKTGRYSNIRPFGYNVDFDVRFVQYHVLPEEEWQSMVHYGKIDPKVCVDFLKDCGWLPRDIGTLVSVVDFFQLAKRGAHNAKEDTLMAVDVYKKLLEIMKSKKENGAVQDLISLLEAE